MSDRWMGLIELGIVFGLVLAWAVRELLGVRRASRAAEQSARDAAGAQMAPAEAGHDAAAATAAEPSAADLPGP